jgi:hypothetical protein
VTVQQLLNLLNGRIAAMGMPRFIDEALIPMLDNAYKQFVNLQGGVSDVEEFEFFTGENELPLPSYVMRLKGVRLADNTEVKILNRADTINAPTPPADGKIHYMLTGVKYGYVSIVNTPLEPVVLYVDVERLPKKSLEKASDVPSDIAETWQNTLTDSALAEIMQLSPNQNVRAQSKEYEARFRDAAFSAKRDKALIKSKPVRSVQYGGI